MSEEKNSLIVKIATPEEVIFSGKCDMVVVPGASGELGILFNHAPLVSLLANGAIRIYQSDTVRRKLFVSGGYIQVEGNEVLIASEFIKDVGQMKISEAKAEQNILKAEAKEYANISVNLIEKYDRLIEFLSASN